MRRIRTALSDKLSAAAAVDKGVTRWHARRWQFQSWNNYRPYWMSLETTLPALVLDVGYSAGLRGCCYWCCSIRPIPKMDPFKTDIIWSVDPQNCSHQMSYFNEKNTLNSDFCPRPRWGSLQHSPRRSDPLAGLKGSLLLRNGRGGG